MARRESTMGLRTRGFGRLKQDPNNHKRYTSEDEERLVIEGRYTKDDVTNIVKVDVTASNIKGATGTYTWIGVKVGAWGSGGSNPNQLVIFATLELDESVSPPAPRSPAPNPPPSVPVTLEALIGDLDVTIQWPDYSGDDPYGLLKLTSMLYPLP